MEQAIHFTLSFSEPQAHYVDVKMNINGFSNQEYIDIKMPVWAPGSYLIREYSKNVERLIANSNNNSILKSEKISKNTWRIHHHGEDCVINYAVYAFETSVRTSHIDESHAFISPVGTFMYIDNYLHLSASVEIELPKKNWFYISTGLEKISPTMFYADDFDILYDSPIEIGNQDLWNFDIDGIDHECAMVGIADYNPIQLTEDITKIVREENRIWGSNPNKNYVFITHNHHNGSGGLEHLNSTVLAATRFSYSQPSSYKNYLSLVAHEYFHLWHVKRLRPKALGPFDYENENYTTGLWIIEGFTSYYDNLIIRRCGFLDEREYLQKLAIDFNTVYNRPGHLLQSAAASSFDTWIKQYRPDENSQNVSISYYNKGAMHAAALDIEIIASTNGQKCLDDVMRAAYEYFYLQENRGFEENEFLELAERVTGVRLKDIFDLAHHALDIDYNLYFNKVGYQLVDHSDEINKVTLGIKIASNESKTIIKHVDRDSGAWIGGLNVDDELIAINGHRIDGNGRALEYFLGCAKADDIMNILVARDGLMKTLNIPVKLSQKKAFSIEQNPNATEKEKELGMKWLETK